MINKDLLRKYIGNPLVIREEFEKRNEFVADFNPTPTIKFSFDGGNFIFTFLYFIFTFIKLKLRFLKTHFLNTSLSSGVCLLFIDLRL